MVKYLPFDGEKVGTSPSKGTTFAIKRYVQRHQEVRPRPIADAACPIADANVADGHVNAH